MAKTHGTGKRMESHSTNSTSISRTAKNGGGWTWHRFNPWTWQWDRGWTPSRNSPCQLPKKSPKGKKDKRRELITKINELNSYIHVEGYYGESKEKEGELGTLNEEFLEDQAAIF